MIKEIVTKIQGNFNKNTSTIDPGFGTRQFSGNIRSINKDGSVNIRRKGKKGIDAAGFYQKLLVMSWTKFLFLFLSAYFLVNVLFAIVYYFIGMENFFGTEPGNFISEFEDAFFFSAQTLTTVGYGHISPATFSASAVGAIESMIGLMGFAMATGLLYGRFSRPKAQLVFSHNIIVAPYRGIRGLMLRVANQNQSELIEAEAQVTMAINDSETGKRLFYTLPLETTKINFLALSWTIVHPFDEKSPLIGLTLEDLEKRNIEIMIILKAFDDTFSQQVYSRTSYKAEDFIFGAKFVPLVPDYSSGKHIHIDLRQVGETEPADLPPV